MPATDEKAVQSLRKLRKQMKKAARQPSPKQVHAIRTKSRRVEALVHAFRLDSKCKGKPLLKAIEPVRKKAGKVRDMDVLIGFATTLSNEGEEQCLIQLLEHLASIRVRSARKLCKTIAAQRKQISGGVKRCTKFVEKQFDGSTGRMTAEREWSADATAAALEIWTELSTWPQLKASNLHPFRLKVKELRYILQLVKNDTNKFVRALGDVKDIIGEWHDWNELAAIEADALHHGTQCALTKQIRSVTRQKLELALSASNKMRETYQSGNLGRDRILSEK